MKILSIETSCDETAVSIIDATGDLSSPKISVLSNIVLSQIKIHEQFGGVFPNLAKREHSKNLGPIIKQALEEAKLCAPKTQKTFDANLMNQIQEDLAREPELFESLKNLFEETGVPQIDLIAVTYGPGLEPALWVGINAAKTLSKVWGIPVLPINHMEGHISSVVLDAKKPIEFPAIAVLISGGHTEIVLVSDWLTYQVVGETRDDAVGEAFDKVARMLGLPYPGGPQISQLASELREQLKNSPGERNRFNFPRPMLNSDNLDFSFSGLKTSVLYALRDVAEIDSVVRKEAALAFEDAIVDTLMAKTRKAIEKYSPKTLIIAGGVIANKTLRAAFEKLTNEFEAVELFVPSSGLSTDNALMIAIAAYIRKTKKPDEQIPLDQIVAQGNVRLS